MSNIETLFLISYVCCIIVLQSILTKILIKHRGNRLFLYAINVLLFPSMLLVIIKEERYTKTGWTAIGNFDFQLNSYMTAINNYSLIVFIMIASYAILNMIVGNKYKFQKSKIIQKKDSNIFFSAFMIIITLIFWIMSSKYKIGITGAVPDNLPFKISGITYYSMRSALPVLLFYYFYTFRVGSITFFMIFLNLMLLSLATMSKYQTSIVMIALFAPSLRDGRYIRSTVLAMAGVVLLQIVPLLRELAFIQVNRKATLLDFNLATSLENALTLFSLENLWLVLISVASRLLSLKNTILALQVDDIGGIGIINFVPGLSYFGEQATDVTYLTYGFYPAQGFATGIDAIGLFLICLYQSPMIFFMVMIGFCALIKLHELLMLKLTVNHFVNTAMVFSLSLSLLVLPINFWFFLINSLGLLLLLKRIRWGA